MSVGQVHAIISAIAMAGAECRLLVFGCGKDSAMWAAANSGGKTVFLENNAGWLRKTKEAQPTLDIRQVDYGIGTVSTSLPIDEQKLAAFPIPDVMHEEPWDVIIIDSPMGYSSRMPGRSLPIYWSSRVALAHTQIFVDDYERELERQYADHFLNATRYWQATIPRLLKEGKSSKGVMLWSMGTGARAVENRDETGRGAVIFLLDSAYLAAFQTFAHSIRKAILADTHDIVVISNDPSVFEDAVVRNLAHRRILLSDSEIDSMKRIDASKVDPGLRHESFGKYTFLKFFAFKDLGYSHHIFLDVDMICLDPDFSFNDLVLPYDFAAAPTMGSKFLQIGDGKSGKGAPEAVLQRIRQMFRRRPGVERSFNSGVFLARRSILSDQSVADLQTIGETNASRLEQQITQRFIATRPGLRFGSLPVSYNFAYAAALAIGKAGFDTLRPKLVFLHFNSKLKPWHPGASDDWLNGLWHAAHAEAEGWIPPPRQEAATEVDARARDLA